MNKKFIPHLTIFGLLFLLFASWLPGNRTQAASNDALCYVKQDASGSNNGTTWADAYSSSGGLQVALANTNCTQIWVASGFYYPGSLRSDSFQLRNGVAIYGGFAGTETSTGQRNMIANETILSGNIGFLNVSTDNSYHVVTASGTNNTAILDGFTITDGYANTSYNPDRMGGGLYITAATPTVRNVVFRNNYAVYGGGLFVDNSAVSLYGITFDSNSASYGGALYNQTGNGTFYNMTFLNNAASTWGGAIMNSSSNPTYRNITVYSNSTTGSAGGGMYNYNSDPVITNAIFWGNTAATNHHQIYNNSGSAPTVSDSVVQDGFTGGTNIITADPQLGTYDNYGGNMQVIPLLFGSPAIDAADGTACPYADQRLLSRNGQGAGCDIGAFEFNSRLHASPGGSTYGLCQSWGSACELRYATSISMGGQEIWASAGQYLPTVGTDREATFEIKDGVALYGGFAETETARDQRNWDANITTLNGNIGIEGVMTDNVYHVVTMMADTMTTILDGFVVMNGYADGPTGETYMGGGVYGMFTHTSGNDRNIIQNTNITQNFADDRGGGLYSSLRMIITNTNFVDNTASNAGGGMAGQGVLTDVLFSGNRSDSGGGAMYHSIAGEPTTLNNVSFENNTSQNSGGGLKCEGNQNITCPMILNDVTFLNNQTDSTSGTAYGGGLHAYAATLTLTNVKFIGNISGRGGGASIGNGVTTLTNVAFESNQAGNRGGGLSVWSGHSLTNVTFYDNEAPEGGGLFVNGNSPLTNVTFYSNHATSTGGAIFIEAGAPTLNHVTFYQNSSVAGGGAIHNAAGGNPVVRNSIFWDDSSEIFNVSTATTVEDSVVQGGYVGGSNVITAAPYLGTFGDHGGSSDTIPLLSGSSAIDTANDSDCPATDQRGVTRPQGNHCDIGAFEVEVPSYPLTVSLAGSSGSVTGDGIDCGSDCSETYFEGTQVTLTANPTPGSTFTGWSGACTGTGTCQVSMTQARSVTASFTFNQYTLTVSRSSTGSGSVSSSPAGISCGNDCTHSYNYNTIVTLTATPISGSIFAGWSGACTGTGTCQVAMTQARSVTAIFDLVPVGQYALTVSLDGTGSGTVTGSGINCYAGAGADCSETYNEGSQVTLTANPDSGSTFTGWSGACSGSGTCQVSMSQARSVTATFTLNQYSLTVSKNGTGSGNVSSSPAGISCGSDCTHNYGYNTIVILTATPISGSIFAGWSGACTGTGTCQVSMTQARSVTASFDPVPVGQYALSVSLDGTGSGTVTGSGINCFTGAGADCSETYTNDTKVTLTANPGNGSTFNEWSGACTGTGTCQVTMNAAKSVSATFDSYAGTQMIFLPLTTK